MKSLNLLAMLCVTSLMIATVRADEPKSDAEQLQGKWILHRGETNGVPLAEILEKQGKKDLQIDFSGDLMTMSGVGFQDHTCRFTLQPDQDPRAIDSVTEETQGKAAKGTRVPGIYSIDGDTLKLCLPNNADAERPKKFEAPIGSGLSVLVLTRVK